MKLHNLIAAARTRRGITLRELEDKTGIGNALLSQMETGKVAQPSFRNIVKISRALGIPLEDLAKTE